MATVQERGRAARGPATRDIGGSGGWAGSARRGLGIRALEATSGGLELSAGTRCDGELPSSRDATTGKTSLTVG
ncbi:MAG: hypothetical protein KDC38_03130, partial [Planctomycetes bacterium]|nr:hypothetical protein [Planctomycetota bacterium]